MKQYIKPKKSKALLLPRKYFNHLASIDKLTRTTDRQNTYKCKLTKQKTAQINRKHTQMKKALRETQTLRARWLQ